MPLLQGNGLLDMTGWLEKSFQGLIPRVLGVALFLCLMGCASNRSTVEWDVEQCCEADVSAYRSYSIEYEQVPGFLEKYLAAGVDAALGEKGLVRDDTRSDVTLELTFSQTFFGGDADASEGGMALDPEDETSTRPYFGGEVQPGGATSFLASIHVEMRDTHTGQLVWAGHLSRIHHLPLGGNLSQAHKLAGIQEGFRALFRDYPVAARTSP